MKTSEYFEENYEFRIGNIKLRKTKNWIKGTPYMEVVKYYPNEYYGCESEFIYDKTREVYYKESDPHWLVSASCFKHPESCFTVAFIEEEFSEEPDITSVGGRPYRLTDEEFLDYKKVLEELYRVVSEEDTDDDE